MNFQKRTLSPRWWQVTLNSLPPHKNLVTATEPSTTISCFILVYFSFKATIISCFILSCKVRTLVYNLTVLYYEHCISNTHKQNTLYYNFFFN